MNFKLVLILILASLVTLFIVQNAAVVEVRFLLWNFLLSRALLIFFTFVVGFLAGWIALSYIRRRREKADRTETAQNQSL